MSWTHLHLALNHVPVLGVPFLLLLLAAGSLRRDPGMKRLALWGLFVLALAAIPIKFTGDFTAEELANEPWLEIDRVNRHEQSADQATSAVFVLGIATGAALLRTRKKKSAPPWMLATVGLLGVVTFLLMARTAMLGGEIHHPEIRRDAPDSPE